MRKLISIFFLIAVVTTSSAQNINDYKYIIIPESFEFLGEVNEYQLNALAKFLFEEEGYKTIMLTENKPKDLNENSCLGLRTRVLNNSGLFVTKLVIQLEDCYGKTVFTSREGRSREKEFRTAYHEALRDAFESFREIDHNYTPVVGTSENKAATTAERQPETEISAKSLPEKNMNVDDKMPAQQARPAYKENTENVYTYAGNNFLIKKTEQGFGLFPEESAEPIAMLIETEAGSNFIYNSLTNQGIAYFDPSKNLVVEYFSRTENKKVTVKYLLKD